MSVTAKVVSFAAVLVVMDCFGADIQKLPEQSVYEISYLPGKELTGRLEDWDGVPEAALTVPMRESVTPVPAGLRPKFRARITDTELQFLLTAEDPTCVFAVAPNQKYLNDCFEIYLDPLYTRDVALDATMSQTSVTPADRDGREISVSGPLPGVRVKRVDFPGGWAAEVAFPLVNRQFEMTPSDGLRFGCNVAYSNNDHPGKSTVDHKIGWSSLDDTDSSWQTPAVYGEFRVRAPGKTAAVPVKEGPAKAEITARRSAGECCEDAAYLGGFRPEPAITRGFNMGVSERDLAAAAAWGANNARFEVITHPGSAWRGLTLDQVIDRAVGIFTNGLVAARKTGVKLILDGRGLPGRNAFVWNYREDYVKFLGALLRAAQPYKDALWAIDVMNEPLDFNQLPYPPVEFRQFFLDTVRDLRKIDRDVWFIYDVGPGGGYYGFRGLKPLPDPRIIYACHFYDPGAFTHQGVDASLLLDQGLMPKAVQGNMRRYPGVYHGRWFDKAEIERRLRPVIDFQRKYRTPIYVGEFSCVSWAPVESTTRYLQDLVDVFEKYGWSWSYHCFRGWPGWNLDTEDGVLVKPKTGVETKRAPIIRKALERNGK